MRTAKGVIGDFNCVTLSDVFDTSGHRHSYSTIYLGTPTTANLIAAFTPGIAAFSTGCGIVRAMDQLAARSDLDLRHAL